MAEAGYEGGGARPCTQAVCAHLLCALGLASEACKRAAVCRLQSGKSPSSTCSNSTRTEASIARAKRMINKLDIKSDEESQIVEDALCLVFLE